MPILKELSLSFGNSHILYLKVEPILAPQAPKEIEIQPIDNESLYFYIKRYSLPDLMSGKINAFLTRSFYKGKENEIDFKGRDVFDLIWYMGQNIAPNYERLKSLLDKTIYQDCSWDEILEKVEEKLKKIKKQHIIMDIQQFIEDQEMLGNFLDNYLEIFNQYYKKQ